MTFTETELQEIIQRTIAETTKKVLAEVQANTPKAENKEEKVTPKVEVVTEKVRLQVPNMQNKNLKEPLNLKELRKERTAQKRKILAEQRAKDRATWNDICPICGQKFEPKNAYNKICGNPLCKQIQQCNTIIKKHTDLRMQELAEELAD